MIIKKLVIYGYGKWIDREFDLSSSLHLFYGENEAGKSTLMSFIHSILFGFPTRHSSLSRYEPKESSRYGGKIIIQDSRFGEVSIERIAGKVTGDVTVLFEDGTLGDEKTLSTLLYDKNRHFFESIYSFNLKGIENIEDMSRDQINRFFLSIGALGNERYLSIADKYKTKASQLYKPTGRKPLINKHASKLEKKQKNVLQAKETNEDYTAFIQKHMDKQEEFTELEKKIEKIKEQLKTLDELSRQEEIVQEIKSLTDEIQELPDRSLPKDGLYQLKHLNEEINRYREKVEELQHQQKDLQEEYRPSNELIVYQEYEAELKAFSNELDYWDEKVQAVHFNKQEKTSLQNQLTETKIRENLPLNEDVPRELTKDEWSNFYTLKTEIEELKHKRIALEDQIKECTYRMDINNDRIDKIEQSLWPLEKFKKIKEKSENRNKKTILKSEKKISVVLFALMISIFFSVLSYVTDQPMYLVGVLVGLIPLFILYRNKEMKHSQLSSQEMNEYYQQKNMRDQWREILATNDSLQQIRREKEEEYKKAQKTMQNKEKECDDWKKASGQPIVLSIEEIEQKQSLFHDLRKMSQRYQLLNGKIETIERELDERLNQLNSYDSIVKNSEDSLLSFGDIKRFIKHVEREIDTQKEYIKKTEIIQRDIVYYIQYEKESSKKKYELLQSLNASNDEEMYKLYQLQDNRKQKMARMHALKEKLPEYENNSEVIAFDKIEPEMKRLNERLSEYKEERTQVMKKMMEVEHEIKELEDGGTYSELLQEFENEKSVYQETVDEWNTLKIAAAIIEKTLQHAKEDKLPQTIQTAEDYFVYLTDGEYTRILVEEDALFVMNQTGVKWNVKELSRGTVEPLYIALRLAFIRNTKDSIRFPVIVDDSFVNLDASRLQRMYQLLLDFSKDCQVIYFSFDQSILSYFSNRSYTHLNEL